MPGIRKALKSPQCQEKKKKKKDFFHPLWGLDLSSHCEDRVCLRSPNLVVLSSHPVTAMEDGLILIIKGALCGSNPSGCRMKPPNTTCYGKEARASPKPEDLPVVTRKPFF